MLLCVGACLLAVAGRAEAQVWESVGTRAQGMGGAFVAVADDATATWWNPAGMATGSLFSMLAEQSRFTTPDNPSDADAGRRLSASSFASAVPVFGFSYYHYRISESRALANTTVPASSFGVQASEVSQFGLTFDHSLTDHLVVASTVKIMRGGAGSGTSTATSSRLDAADNLSFARHTRLDLDAGVMAVFDDVRVGFTARNLTRPDFGDEAHPLALDRQARAGVAWVRGAFGALDAFTLSSDVDLTTNSSDIEPSRRVAGGAEAWLVNRHLGLRGGVTHNTVGSAATAWSSGGSIKLTSGLSFDVARTAGNDQTLRGWSGSVRLVFF
jgi:hypothetical protein